MEQEEKKGKDEIRLELGVKERLIMPELCPKSGNFVTQGIVRDIVEKIKLSQAEVKLVNLRPAGEGGMVWDTEKEVPKKVSFTKAEFDLLKNQVITMDKENKITQSNLSTCLKIRDLKVE